MRHVSLRRIWIVLLGGAVLALGSAALTPSVAAAPTCIYIVQGLPSLTVSVTVDGKTVVDRLAGGKVAGPFPVKSGTRTVTVSEGDETLATSNVKLAPGSNSEVVVHLPASPTGDPVITRFDNNLEAVQTGRAAHSVAHVAAAGPVDIRVNGRWSRPMSRTASTPTRWFPPGPAAWTSSRPDGRSPCSARWT